MNSFRPVLFVLVWSGLSFAQLDGGSCVVAPNARFTVFFDRAPLVKVAKVVSDLTCKRVVAEPGAGGIHITIGTKENKPEFTPSELFAAFVAAAEVKGLKVVEDGGTIRITK